MNKFKGVQLNIKNKEYVLREQLGEGMFIHLYSRWIFFYIFHIEPISFMQNSSANHEASREVV
jgi:hypothetical protein